MEHNAGRFCVGAMAVGVEALNGIRVVICEDEALTVMQLERALKRAGLLVVGTARDARQAVEVVLRERPDLVLMDVTMPGGMDGVDAVRQILDQVQTCVVMVTARTEEEMLRRAADVGVAGYISKPVSAEALLNALPAALDVFASRVAHGK